MTARPRTNVTAARMKYWIGSGRKTIFCATPCAGEQAERSTVARKRGTRNFFMGLLRIKKPQSQNVWF
jgi:hypothetical protein